MKKNLLVLLSLLVVASLALAACGDIGNPPAEFPAMAYSCPAIHTDATPTTQAYLAKTAVEWAKLRTRIMWKPYESAGFCK